MISTLNIINLFFPRDTKRRSLFKKAYYSIHSFLPRLSYNFRDCKVSLLKLSTKVNQKKSGQVLVFDHKMGGGSNIYRDSIAKKYIEKGMDVILVIYNYKDRCYIIRYNGRQKSVILDKQAVILYEFIQILTVQDIVINDLVSFPEPENLLRLVLELKENMGCRLAIPLHDYYPICPSYNLLDINYKYCGLPPIEICENCLAATKLEEILHKPDSIASWRIIWRKALASADEIILFSKSSGELLLKAYPGLTDSVLKLRPHKVDYIKEVVPLRINKKIIIGIPGNINLAKGSGIVAEMIELIENDSTNNAEIVIIGILADIYCRSPRLAITGNYRREHLSRIIESYKINMIFIPSIWPETFSFTTEEAILTGLPVAAFRIGAPAERLGNYSKAVIIDEISSNAAYDMIVEYFSHNK